MKYLAISDFKEWDFAQELALKHSLGFESQLFTKNENLDNRDEIEAYTISSDIPYHSYHGPFRGLNHLSDDPRECEIAREYYTAFYREVKELGATHIVFHTGFIPEEHTYSDWYKRSIIFWDSFLADKDDTLEIHLENVYEDSFTALNDLIDELQKPWVKICLDMGHANMSSETPVDQWVKAMGARIGSVHMHNNNGKGDQHLGLVNGTIDMEKALQALQELAPQSVWVLETKEKEESFNWLKMNGYIS